VNPDPRPESVAFPFAAIVEVAVEHWRLAAWLAGGSRGADAGVARHALRKIGDFLQSAELEVRGLEGHPFDPGLAARVVDVIDDPTLPQGRTIIDETLSPLVLWRGQVIKPADIVTRRGTGRG
jgi:hypothetical protein